MPLNLISVSMNGASANDASFNPAVTPDGHVIAFASSSSNLDEGDSNARVDIFRRDQLTGLITRVSLTAAGAQANGDSGNPSLAANGNLVAFQSTATNLVTHDINATSDIFVKNVVTGEVILASVTAAGIQSNTPSTNPVLSADGRYVAFLSTTPLPSGGSVTDIFVKDLQTGTLTLVSTNSSSVQANGESSSPSFSADGRYVAFVSSADNLVAGDTNQAADVFVRDLVTGGIQRVSVSASGAQANDHNLDVSISADGHFVAFSSVATNLVAGTTAYNRDLYVKNLLTGEVVLASVASGGGRANSYTYGGEISADGRFVVFRSTASNLVPGDTNLADDIFVRDLTSGTTTRMSLTGSGGQASGNSGEPHISADGKLVLFWTSGGNVAPGVGSYQIVTAQNGAQGADVFAPTLLSAAPASGAALVTPGANIVLAFNEPVVAGTGSLILTNAAGDTRTIAVASSQVAISGNTVTINPATDLLPGSPYRLSIPAGMLRDSAGNSFAGTGGNPLGFTTGDPGDTTTPTLAGASPSNNAAAVQVGADITLTFSEPVKAGGGLIYISSTDTQGTLTVPVTDKAQVTINGSTVRIDPTFDLQPGKTYSIHMFSGAFVDGAGRAFAGIAEGALKFTTVPFGTGTSALVRASLNAQGSPSNGDSNDADLSGDGHLVAYENVFTSRFNGVTLDVYVKDVTTGALTTVSATAAGVQGNDFSTSPAISNDGRFVVFASAATNLAATDGNGHGSDILLKDLTTGAFTLVSMNSNGVAGNSDSMGPAISADGHVVAFLSDSNNLVSGDNNGFRDVFVKNLLTGALIRANTAANGTQSTGQTNSILSLSADGQLLAFASNGSNLVANDTNGAADVFVKTIATGAIARVSTAANGAQANGLSDRPSLSDDGRFVVFQSLADNLVPGDGNQVADVFVKNLSTGAITLVSANAAGQIGNGGSFDASISSDGHFVSFSSTASNLVPGDTNSNQDVFVKDLWTGSIRLVSHAPGGVQGNDTSLFPTISPNGQVVAFVSRADNLVPDDRNGAADILVRTLNAPDDPDSTSPVLIAATPANGASAVALGSRIFLTFSEAVRPGTGALILQPANGGPGIVIAASDPGQITFANDSVVIHPHAALDVATRYNVVIADTAIQDLAGNGFAGLAGDAFHFTTAAQAVPVVPRANQYVGTARDEFYIVDHSGDVVVESLAAGVDMIESLLGAYTLPANVENLVFIGTGPFAGTGNALDNVITGGTADDTILAGAGADTLEGRAGADKLTGAADGDRFVFSAIALSDAQATTPLIDWITDFNRGNTGAFNAAEGDRIDVTALASAAFLGGQQVGNLVRVLSDGTNARLQIDTDGTANGTGWVSLARVDGLQAGQQLGVLVNGMAPAQFIAVLGSETINNQDGSRIEHRVDALNGQPYTDYYLYYDALNRVTSQLTNYDDGSRINQVWDVQSQNDWANYYITYDSQSRIVGQVTQNDDSSYIVLKWDVAGVEDWADYYVTYDGQNRPITQVTHNDDGSRIVFKWDRDNTQEWSDYRVTYDSQGRPITQVTNNDDGSRIVFKWDLDNQFSWSDYRVTDKLGQSISQVTNNDDGTHQTYGWDASNQASWSDYVVTTDSQNRATEQTTHYDDGTYTVAKWDVVNQFGWREMTDYYNAQGQHVQQRGVYDDGTTWLT